MKPSFLWLLQLLHLAASVSAASGNWTKPNGQAPSFTDTYTVGERIFVSWLNLNNSLSDLWLTRYDTSVNNFAVRLQVARNISIPDAFEWTIGVDTVEIAKDTRFILQFLPTGAAYDATKIPEIPSPAFNLILVNQQAPPNGTIGAPNVTPSVTSVTSSATPTPSSSTTSSSIQPTATPPPDKDGPGVNKAVVIGVSITAVVLALGSVLGAFFVVRAYRKPKTFEPYSEEFKASGPYEILGNNRHPMELSSKETMVYEMNSPTETLKSARSIAFEISTTTKKPGLHELPS